MSDNYLFLKSSFRKSVAVSKVIDTVVNYEVAILFIILGLVAAR